MPVLSSVLFVIALILAVVIGPQTRAWSWGPALVPLGLALLAAIPPLVRKGAPRTDGWIVGLGIAAAGWFAWRAWVSPVAEFAQADLLLLSGALASFLVMRAIQGNAAAERVLVWGLALLLLASVVVLGRQVADPSYSPLFGTRASDWPSGFFAHYNEGANFLIGASFLLAATAWVGPQRWWEKMIWSLIALAGLVAVYFTHSRGGILAVAVGLAVFFAIGLAIGKRRGTKWFAPALIGIPLIGALIMVFLYQGWAGAQEVRSQSIDSLGDNAIRLSLMGIAVSSIADHPWAGGGSRSFSWEVLQHWQTELHGWGTARPEQVHNELLQAATDYGLTGAGLLAALLIALVTAGIVRSLFADKTGRFGTGDAWRLGGIAGLAGMFVQSSFSFVFHLLPGAILLGMCLGRAAFGPEKPRKTGHAAARLPELALAGISLVLAVGLLPVGWTASRTTAALWHTYFAKSPVSPAARLAALDQAINHWPTAELFRGRAMLLQEISAADVADFPADDATRLAVEDYTAALALHPFDATSSVNRANLLSTSQRASEAEEEFARAIRLQGGLESAFRARFHLARHWAEKGGGLMAAGNHPAALEAFQEAQAELETVRERFPSLIRRPDGVELEASILEGLGGALEGMEDFPAALDAYMAALRLPPGRRVHYRAGALLTQLGTKTWHARKPSEAFAYFLRAREHLAAANELPEGVTAADKEAFVSYIDRSIALFTEAKVTPR